MMGLGEEWTRKRALKGLGCVQAAVMGYELCVPGLR